MEKNNEFLEKLVHINRITKVVKGGRRFGFSALVVVGNLNGKIGVAHAKAKQVPDAIKKANELAKRNITVNCVAPGFIETSMTAVLSESQREALVEKIPMGKIGSPKDVANCVEFLVSDKSEYVTGQTIHVNGGLAML